jgi:para-nitrobenzyl esterase
MASTSRRRSCNPRILMALPIVLSSAIAGQAFAQAPPQIRVNTDNGMVQGTEQSGIRSFKGIPFAAPPVGDLRWKEPQPAAKWRDVRQATQFGPRCMQAPIYSDMVFRSNGVSEDCLYLNVWTPASGSNARLPVLVYFYGGGFAAGDGSEPRYDGENMARQGIVALTVNYRLGVFGFLAHPELTKESPHHASGNYGLLDQAAALRWVQKNIAAFGGDPKKVTIAGESAGSISVSVLMASPLSKGLIAGAIGESGASIAPTLPPVPLAEAEQTGVKFATGVGAASLAALRAMTAQQLLETASKPGGGRFPLMIDHYLLPKSPAEIFAAGEQAHVPLLVGWNSEEMSGRALLRGASPTVENYTKAVRAAYADRADDVLKLYPASADADVLRAATDLAGDRFIAYSTWKWADLHRTTGSEPVYLYLYAHPRPAMVTLPAHAQPARSGANGNGNGTDSGNGRGSNSVGTATSPPRGAVHSAEIEYAMGNLAGNTVYAWTAEDRKISEVMHAYFANFVKAGDPNGSGLPRWPAMQGGQPSADMHGAAPLGTGASGTAVSGTAASGAAESGARTAGAGAQVMRLRIDVETQAEPVPYRDRYQLFDQLFGKRSN